MDSTQAEMARNDAMAQLRQQLHGCQYSREMTKDQEAFAKAHGLVVVFGYSDDNVELRGAIDDEVGASDGTVLRITRFGVLPEWETFCCSGPDEIAAAEYFAHKASGVATIQARFSPDDKPGYTWAFDTAIPHLVFLVMEDGEAYGEGLIFALADVAKAVQ